MRLHLGCGLHTPEGWVNIDYSIGAWFAKHRIIKAIAKASRLVPASAFAADWPAGILIHDVRRSLPFRSGSVEAIYSSNMLEHLYRDEARKLLKECHRVLQPVGVLRIVVPDLAVIVGDYCARRTAKAHLQADSPGDLLNQQLAICELSPPDGNRILRFYYALRNTSHKYMFDEASLSAYFREAGFINILRCGLYDSRIAGIDAIERPEHFTVHQNLCVEGVKAGSAPAASPPQG